MTNNEYMSKYGKLLTPDAKLHRMYFAELVKLLGIQVFYRAPLPNKHYNGYTEIESNYHEPLQIGCIFHDHPDQATLKKMGWVSELQEDASLIDVPYDTPDLQQGALFFLPSGLDNGKARLFRVVGMKNSMVYPSAITCELVPEFEDTFVRESYDYEHSDFNLLREEEDCNQ